MSHDLQMSFMPPHYYFSVLRGGSCQSRCSNSLGLELQLRTVICMISLQREQLRFFDIHADRSESRGATEGEKTGILADTKAHFFNCFFGLTVCVAGGYHGNTSHRRASGFRGRRDRNPTFASRALGTLGTLLVGPRGVCTISEGA